MFCSARQARALATVVIAAGSTFYVRRVLQRVERGELDVAAATRAIAAAHAASPLCRLRAARAPAFG